MITPGEKVLRALTNLESNEDFATVVRWLDDTYKEQLQENIDTIEEVRLRWGQGKARLLADLLGYIGTARTFLARCR